MNLESLVESFYGIFNHEKIIAGREFLHANSEIIFLDLFSLDLNAGANDIEKFEFHLSEIAGFNSYENVFNCRVREYINSWLVNTIVGLERNSLRSTVVFHD